MTYWGINKVLWGQVEGLKKKGISMLDWCHFVSQCSHLCTLYRHTRILAHTSQFSYSPGQKEEQVERYKSTQIHENFDQRKQLTPAVKKESSHHWHLKCHLWFVATLLTYCLQAGILVSTRNKLGWKLKPESYLQVAEKTNLHYKTIQPEGKFGASKSSENIQIHFLLRL